ncbi:MAG: fibronectin type III domain-containing protein [Lachnospiraceae bacterium]|nr:fibronectin type III domain-containing protein [Lachnospiraceae bacterium]
MQLKKKIRCILLLCLAVLLMTGTSASAATKKPGKVSVLSAKTDSGKVTVRWKSLKKVSGYQVYMYTDAKKYEVIARVTGASKNSLTVKGLENGKKYRFRVTAYNKKSGKIYEGKQSKTIQATPKPKKPAKPVLHVSLVASRRVNITWTKSSAADGYIVYQKLSSGDFKKLGETKDTRCCITKLTNDQTYYFKVRAFREVNGKRYYSSYSNIVEAYVSKTAAVDSINYMHYRAALKSSEKTTAGLLGAGTVVTITQYVNGGKSYCKLSNGKSVRIESDNLELLETVTDNTRVYDQEAAEAYVNKKGFKSATNYLVWISMYTQHIYVFKGSRYHWTLAREPMLCSTGSVKNGITTSGVHRIYYKLPIWNFDGSYARYGMAFNGDNAIHSQLYLAGTTTPYDWGTLGKPASHGCVRIKLANAEWMYNTVPVNSTVVHY